MKNDARIIMICKGFCIRHKAPRPHDSNGNRYSTGQKRCQICEIFIKWDGLWCPCCSYMLRMRPRNLKSESKLRARKKIAEYQLLLQQQKKTMKVDV
jgi:hypothetical protein